jgi:hypothetical protein
LGDFLTQAGHAMTITENAEILTQAADLSRYDAMVFNRRLEALPELADLTLSPAAQAGLPSFIQAAKGFVCLHIAT